MLTIPITVATGESFSKLKLIRTYLWSSMTRDKIAEEFNLSTEKGLLKIGVESARKRFADPKLEKMF